MQSPNNELYSNFCCCAVSCDKNFLVESHQNTSKHQTALGSRSEQPIPHTLQMFLRSSNTDFVEKVTEAFLSADIPLYKLNSNFIKNLFLDNGHSLLSETTCRKTALQLSVVELQRIRNVVGLHDIFFWLLTRALFKYSSWKPRNTSHQLFAPLPTFIMWAK